MFLGKAGVITLLVAIVAKLIVITTVIAIIAGSSLIATAVAIILGARDPTTCGERGRVEASRRRRALPRIKAGGAPVTPIPPTNIVPTNIA